MTDHKIPTVLVVDDEKYNLDIVDEYLSDIEIETVCVDSGEIALSLLQESPLRFSAVLLDRMMPGIDGIDVLLKIKADPKLNRLPVIMQTAKVGKEYMLEGLKAGAHYYLSKPYDQQTLIAIVSTAVRDYQHYIYLQDSLKTTAQTLKMMDKGEFRFKSLDEGRNLAVLLANACPNSDSIVLGLTELMINALEHGNLGITYEEKSRLSKSGEWENEIIHRLALPRYKHKYATIKFNRSDNEITFLIIDQGSGFDWQQYMEISPQRAFDSHGRGIAMANSISFNKIEYLGNGNKVCVTVPLQ
jgi:CheY-like chemotaxis protein/anti-sigma regulatory factor (Ser/Thr protein kinase)